MTIIGIVLCGLSLAGLIYWSVFAVHLIRTIILIPTARHGLKLPLATRDGLPPVVAAFVPAHNEESCIAIVARSLAEQRYPQTALHAVFALDRCTDRTEPLLREAVGRDLLAGGRFTIHPVGPRREGWAGKTNALASAVEASPIATSADYLLFIDADTHLHPDCIRACVALMQKEQGRDLAMLTLLSTLTSDRWFERWVQPAASIELIRQFPIVRANSRDGHRPFANGQFIMMSRAAYEQIGGHSCVARELLEDVAMSRAVARAGLPVGVFLADGLLRCRMYADWGEFRSGWARIYKEAANRKPERLRAFARRLRFTGAAMPVAAILTLLAASVALALPELAIAPRPALYVAAALGALALCTVLFTIGGCQFMGRSAPWRAIGYPLGAWITASILHRAARDLETGTPTVWAGMSYQRERR